MTTPTLKRFRWQGHNPQAQPVQGETQAASIVALRRILRRQGIVPTRISRSSSLWQPWQRLRRSDIVSFTRQLSTLINAGVPLLQSFTLMRQALPNPQMQALLQALHNAIEQGSSLSDSLRQHPRYFDSLFCNLVMAGEQSGTLDTLLDRLATHQEALHTLRQKLRNALIYPMIVVLIATIVTAVLLGVVIPKFQTLFQSLGAPLPWFTQQIINLSHSLQSQGLVLLLAIVALIIACHQAKRRIPSFSEQIDAWVLRLPGLGMLLRKAIIARCTRTLATTFNAGLPLMQALSIAASIAQHSQYRNALLSAQTAISRGATLNTALAATECFPPLVIQLIAIGESSGTLDTMLAKIASLYEADVTQAIDNLHRLLEPVLMVFLGVVVGGLVLAMYWPVFSMGAIL